MSDNLFLFADNNQGTAENLGSYRLYNMKIDGDSEGVESGVDYVDCLIGDGASYIDTGMAIPSGYKVEVTFMSTVQKAEYISNDWCAIFGCSNEIGFTYDTQPYGMSVGLYSTNIAIKNNGQTNLQYANIKDTCYNKKYILSLVAGENNTNPSNILVFANNNLKQSGQINPYPFAHNYLKIYDFKIYNAQGDLIQHLKPCLDTEGIPCMYDEVSGEYFHNQGTGTFGYKKKLRDFQPVLDSNGVPCLMDKVNKKYYYDKNGKGFGCEEGYTSVSYLQGDGSSWINTGIIPTENIKIIVNGHFSQVKQYDTLFGGDGTKVQCGANSNQIYAYSGQSQHLHAYTNAVNIPHIYTLTHTQLKIDNDVLSLSSTGTIQNYSIILFGGWSKGVIEKNYLSQGKVYYFKIYQSDELVFDGIPVLDNEGTPCLYDLVTETFFYNQGTGEFSYGIEEDECPKANYVEYISSYEGGFRRIPLDFSLYSYNDTNMSYEYKATFNQRDNVSMPIGTIRVTTDKQIPIYFYRGASRNLQIRCGNVNVQEFNFANANAGNTYVLSYNTQGNQEILANGKNVGTLDITGTMMSTDNLVLFDDTGVNSWTNANRYWQGDFYYFKMWYNGNLIHEILPCLDDNGEVAVYDTVTNKLYQQQVIQSNNIPLTSVGSSYNPIKYIETNGTQYIDTGVVVNDNTDIDMVASAVGETPLYLMNELIIDTTYNFKEINTNVEPNLTASDGATLTLGSTYMSYLTEDEIEQAVKNGWTIQ